MSESFMIVAMNVAVVVEVLLLTFVLYNLFRYKYLGNKFLYAGISFVCVFLCALYVNNHAGFTFSNLLESVFDSFKAAVGSIDKEKVAFLDQDPTTTMTAFKIVYTAVSFITLGYLSIAVILGTIRSFTNGFVRNARAFLTAKDVYYIFTDSRNETALPLAQSLLSGNKRKSVSLFVSRSSLKTQEGSEFKDMLVGKKINVCSENFTEKFCKKIFNSSFFSVRCNFFKKKRRYYIYLLFSDDEMTTKVADSFKNTITNNRTIKKYLANTKAMTQKQMDEIERVRVLVTYQYTDIDLIHDYSGKTLHIMNSLSKYDMVSNKFLFDNPISNFVDLEKVSLEKDNENFNVTFFGLGVINRPIFEKMTYSYQLFGDNINKINYHIFDRDSESLVNAYQNEYTDKKSKLFLYSVEALGNGADLRQYETIDKYIASIKDDPHRFNNDGFEIFVISVINSNNDLQIAENLRNIIYKYIKPENRKKTYIYVRIGEGAIQKQLLNAKNMIISNEDVFNGFNQKTEKIPIILFGNDQIMDDYLTAQYDFVNQHAFLVFKSYEKDKEHAKQKWLTEDKNSVNKNTCYVHSLRTKMGFLGINIDKDFNFALDPTKSYDDLFNKEYFNNEEFKHSKIVKLANLEHNRWLQDSNINGHFKLQNLDENTKGQLFEVNSDGDKCIKSKHCNGTTHICMLTNKDLVKLYGDLVKLNPEYEEEAYKLVYGNDINQLQTVIDFHTPEERN